MVRNGWRFERRKDDLLGLDSVCTFEDLLFLGVSNGNLRIITWQGQSVLRVSAFSLCALTLEKTSETDNSDSNSDRKSDSTENSVNDGEPEKIKPLRDVQAARIQGVCLVGFVFQDGSAAICPFNGQNKQFMCQGDALASSQATAISFNPMFSLVALGKTNGFVEVFALFDYANHIRQRRGADNLALSTSPNIRRLFSLQLHGGPIAKLQWSHTGICLAVSHGHRLSLFSRVGALLFSTQAESEDFESLLRDKDKEIDREYDRDQTEGFLRNGVSAFCWGEDDFSCFVAENQSSSHRPISTSLSPSVRDVLKIVVGNREPEADHDKERGSIFYRLFFLKPSSVLAASVSEPGALTLVGEDKLVLWRRGKRNPFNP